MKELYNEYFHIPKHGKIRDKVMLTRTAITAGVIIICLAVMSFTAYAYFSCSVTSGSNIIRAANFEANVSINITDANGEAVAVNRVDSKTHTAALEADNTYFITLDESENSTAKTGFCVVTADGCPDTYHTQQLGVDAAAAEGATDKITFRLTVTADTTVTFLSHWGTSSHYDAYSENGEADKLYITNADIGDNAVGMVIDGVVNSIGESDEEKQTVSEETTAAETAPAEVVYTVQSGDTLSEIAAMYGTTAARIAAYNGLSDANIIQVGQQLKIPSADWVMPAAAAASETAAPETTDNTETAASEKTAALPEAAVTEPADTTSPAEPAAPTETAGIPEASASAEAAEPVETTSVEADTEPEWAENDPTENIISENSSSEPTVALPAAAV